MKHFHKPLALALFVALAGCSDTTAPEEAIVGTWEVQEIEGEDLPFSETEEVFPGVECTVTVESIDITFTAAGAITAADESSFACGGEPAEDTSTTRTGTYSITDDRITTTFTEDGETETETQRFVISGDTLEVFDGTSAGAARIILATRR